MSAVPTIFTGCLQVMPMQKSSDCLILANILLDRFKAIRALLKNEKLYFEKRRAFGDFLAQSSATVAVFGSFVYIAFKTAQGTITLGDMVMYFQGFQKGLWFPENLS